MNFCSPGDARANAHLSPAGKPAPPRPRTVAALTSSSRLSGVCARARARGPTSPRAASGPARQHARPLGLARRRRVAPASTRSTAPSPASITLAVANRGRGVAEAEADGLGERHRAVLAALAERQAESPRASRRHARRRWPRSTPCRCTRARGARRAGRAGRRRRSRRRTRPPPAAPRRPRRRGGPRR